jgi:hypothetical protein
MQMFLNLNGKDKNPIEGYNDLLSNGQACLPVE